MGASIGLVVPAYNPDVERLSEYVYSLFEAIDRITIRIELDSVEAGISERLADLPAHTNAVTYRRGKGAAITDGFEALNTDVLAFADADGATPAEEVRSVINRVSTGETDLAVGSRRHPDSTVHSNQTDTRRYMGHVFVWIARRFLDVQLYDYQCGTKAVSSTAWNEIREHLYEPGFAWDIEVIAMTNAHNLRIEEVPIQWYDKPGSSVDPISTAIELFRAVILARYRTNQMVGGYAYRTLHRLLGEPPALVEQH